MSLPYFPMFPADFDADTGHLSMAEDGAYNRLLRLQWRCPNCKLPNDLGWIFRKTRAVTDADQAVVETIIKEFFTRNGGKIFNARLLKEWVKSEIAHEKRVSAGSKGGTAKTQKTNEKESSNAKAMLKQPEPEPEPEESKKEGGDGSASARGISDDQSQTFREQILTACGVDPVSGLTGHGGRQLGTQGDMAEAGRWLDLPGITEATAIAEVARIMAVKRDGPPKSLGYFTEAMRRLSGSLTAPKLTPAEGQSGRSDASNGGETEQEKILRIMRSVGINTNVESMQ